MPWNLQPLRAVRAAIARSTGGGHGNRIELPPGERRQLLAIFRRHAAVLQLTVDRAPAIGTPAQHAALAARLAILQARVEAGEASRSLVVALIEFGNEFNAFMASQLGDRGA